MYACVWSRNSTSHKRSKMHQQKRGTPGSYYNHTNARMHAHTPFNGPLSGTTQISRYQKGKTNLDFTEARDSEWQWHQLGHMQVCTSLQTNNHASMPPLSFLQAGCPSCHPTNSVKALKATISTILQIQIYPIKHCKQITKCNSAQRNYAYLR